MKKNIKTILALSALTILTTGVLSGCGNAAPADENGAKTVTVAVAPGFYPITYADDNGKAQGYDVEVFKAIDELLDDYNFVYEIADKETMNVGVQTGTYQVGINSLFKTAARVETYYLPENNMGYTPVGIIQKADDTIKDLTVAHDTKRTIYPIFAAGGIRFVVDNWNTAHPDKALEYELVSEFSYADLFASIKSGDYDYAVDLIPVFNLQKEETVAGLKITDPVDVVPTYPIVNKKEEALGNAINSALATLKENGTLSKLSVNAFGYDVFAIN